MRFSLLSLCAASAAATDLLLPLYTYPGTNGASWSSVASALSSNSELSATIIINVSNGPGSPFGTTDGPNWAAGGKLLADLPNVSLVGYVHCTRCQRAIADVKADIAQWASWNSQGVHVGGIFIDEAPNDGSCVQYMSELTQYIRSLDGLGDSVVYNAGFPATPNILDSYFALNPTYISAFETCWSPTSNGEDLCDGSYTPYDQDGYGTSIDNVLKDWVGTENYAKTAILVHGFHGSNGFATANSESLLSASEAIVARGIGAAVFTTNHWITPDAAPADIQTMATTLNAANKQ
ncbi:unnamed protein product [Clonostachys rosea f. rosea IK726]|jgi:hypothetical protein|uniref:Uncharacterized protein n=2 Tax=Bionectria ochroleuca TaxID=29856 RepID=A0A8H7K398_BIOOC|nr:unnamed protein product [Clonostachys rosea f. rosea IK726]